MAKRLSEYRTREEEIHARMMRNASKIWGQPNSSQDAFDPLVGMLLSACATEVGRVYDELESSQSRILERLSSLLTPDVHRGPRAAHAIMHARTTEPSFELSKEFQFYTQKRLPQRENSTREEYSQVFFTPSLNTRLFDARVKFLVFENQINVIDRINERSKIAEARSGKRLASRLSDTKSTPLYIGIELGKRMNAIEGMSFFFDWLYSAEKSSNYNQLAYSRWFIDNVEISGAPGIYSTDGGGSTVDSFQIDIENDIAKMDERDITALYNARFIHLTGTDAISVQSVLKNYPKEFEEVFATSELAELKEPMLWIRVEFTSPRANMLNDLVCTLNCFPVMARHLNEFSYRLHANSNIIPLKVKGESFYAICAVRGSDNKAFVQHNTKDFAKSKSGTYVLRQGGIERFDRRDAAELLHYLIELMRDESAAFAVYGNDIISAQLRELNQMLNTLTMRVEGTDVNDEMLTYVVVKPLGESDNIFLEFWTTHGAFANAIRSGTSFTASKSFDMQPNSIELITGTVGGSDAPDSAQLLLGYRKSLMTRGRVVTANDIELFIRNEDPSSQIGRIGVTRGVESNPSAKAGLTRTIEVHVVPQPGMEQLDWSSLCYDLEVKLAAVSSAFFPIRVKVKQNELLEN
jgi:hypothetical protein